MAGITSAGVGSGLDINGLVQQLVAADRQPADQQLNRLQARANMQLSALGTFQSALATLQTSVNALKASGAVSQLAAQPADATVFTASAGTGAVAGSYNIEVVSQALAGKAVSSAYASTATVVGDGTITIGMGAASFTVTLAPGSDTLQNLQDAINSATNNPGVSAAIVNDINGAHLMLTGNQTGANNAITVTSAATAGGAAFFNTTSLQAAADAHIRVNGLDNYSHSNVVTGAINGLTLNLLKASPGTQVGLTVGVDTKAATDAIQKLVTSYNALVATIATTTKFDPTTKSGGPLMGDAAVRGISQQLRKILGGTVSGTGSAYSQLSDLGVTTKVDGTLVLDTTKLSNALTKDPASVQKLFSATTGYATVIGGMVDSYLGTSGQVTAETQGLQAQLKSVQTRRDQLDLHMKMVEDHYRSQFTALDTLIGQLRSTSSYLTQQLASLSNSSTSTGSK